MNRTGLRVLLCCKFPLAPVQGMQPVLFHRSSHGASHELHSLSGSSFVLQQGATIVREAHLRGREVYGGGSEPGGGMFSGSRFNGQTDPSQAQSTDQGDGQLHWSSYDAC